MIITDVSISQDGASDGRGVADDDERVEEGHREVLRDLQTECLSSGFKDKRLKLGLPNPKNVDDVESEDGPHPVVGEALAELVAEDGKDRLREILPHLPSSSRLCAAFGSGPLGLSAAMCQ